MKKRISKKGQVRKKELIDAAYLLFSELGYDNTSVNAIIEKVGVSKGAFYYHFESKEDLLDTMVKAQVEQILRIAREVTSARDLSAIGKFNLMFARIQAYRITNMDILYKLFEFYLNEENIRYRYKLEEYTIEKSLAFYTALIQQGIDEGSFKITNPDLTAEFIMRVFPVFRMKMALIFLEPGNDPRKRKEIERIANFMEASLTNLLKCELGAIKIADSFVHLFAGSAEHQTEQ
jgi:AcrR family transcriptional regulator